MERIGTGKGVVALMNGHAKRVTPRMIRLMRRVLPDALILVSEDFAQARRHAARIAEEKPYLLLSGGGDGTATQLLTLLRERGVTDYPAIGLLKLGTGNGWANVVGAIDAVPTIRALPRVAQAMPTLTYDLVDVEGRLCTFAGVGWDARILNDYLRNLDRRSSQLFGSRIATRLHKGVGGYLYSLARITVPEELMLLMRDGQARVTVENLGGEAFALDALGRRVVWGGLDGRDPRLFYEGPISVGGAATSEEFGFGFRAYPCAREKPGFLNVRIYDRPVVEAVRSAANLWRGRMPQPGMHDYYATAVRMRFSRPMPFQIGGDGDGTRESVTFKIGERPVRIVDWKLALAQAGRHAGLLEEP